MNMQWYRKRWIGLIIAVLFGVGSALSLHAEETSKDKDEEIKPYGNTPEDLRPYRQFVKKPYKQFFVSPPDNPIEFFGPGRDKPEPDVETVKIGLLAPPERTHEDYMGRSMLWGTQMAIDEANAAGGYTEKPLELIVRNDSGLWDASANEIAAFSYEDKVWAIIGSVDGANTHIAIRVALKTEVIDVIRKAGLNRYRIRDELAKMKLYQGVTGEIMMDDVYSDRSLCIIATVRNGKFVFGEPKMARLFYMARRQGGKGARWQICCLAV